MKFLSHHLYMKVKTNTKNIFTKEKNTTITEHFVNKTIRTYNGKQFIPINVTANMIGHKLGEFCLTKKIGRSIHSSARNKKKREKMKAKMMAKKIRKSKK